MLSTETKTLDLMTQEYKKLKAILNKKFHLKSSEINPQKDLVNDFGLCDWELQYLFSKVENEFNINLVYTSAPQSITVHHLLQDIRNCA